LNVEKQSVISDFDLNYLLSKLIQIQKQLSE